MAERKPENRGKKVLRYVLIGAAAASIVEAVLKLLGCLK